MDKGDVEMLDAEKNVPASDVLVSNKSPVKYKNGVKTGKSNDEDHLISKSQPEAHGNVVLENKTPTIDVGTDDMESSYLKWTDDEVQNIDEGEVNEVHQSEKMIYEDPQMEANPTTVTTNGDARSCEFPKVKLKVTDSSIGKMPEPASPMFLINPSTANAGEHSGEAYENIFAVMADCEDDEGSLKDQATFLVKLGRFYREKAMKFKPPKFYGHHLNFLKLWRSMIRLGGYDPILLQYKRDRTQNRELQLPIALPPGFLGVDNEGSGYQISTSGRAVRDSDARCRLGWKEQHLLGYGEVAEPIVKDTSAYNTPKHAKSIKTSGSIKNRGQNEVEHPMKAAETETSKQLDIQVVDVGPLVDWVQVQSDPAGRLVITGQPNQLNNLWGVPVFKNVVTLPARIDQLRINAIVGLHGCLHVHVPFGQQNL
ncbi:hypothetical protein H5410_061703 [Solanum commersonii]|uniref:ARID domain-containing protein n=1 Tax=Solanum commersonii TaxID=4109 RepID=A0A9J5W8Q8_SOLCO|nr:hypothetical protein H5410_061703 [Solanum commersonii]